MAIFNVGDANIAAKTEAIVTKTDSMKKYK